jgi:hypothetical protein
MSTAHYEYWWQKSGRFNIDLYNHFLRAKRDEEFLSNNLQNKRGQVETCEQNNSSQQSRGCNQEDGHVASVNFKS